MGTAVEWLRTTRPWIAALHPVQAAIDLRRIRSNYGARGWSALAWSLTSTAELYSPLPTSEPREKL